MESCRVLIADDNVRARVGLRALLALWPEIEVVGEAVDGLEVVATVRDRQPDAVLMDARMPLLDGLEATRRIKARWPGTRIVVISMFASLRTEALAAGADRFLLKGSPAGELLAAILDRAIPDR
jgi:DNA-binding NarL/FixJ family response regulator